jgi:hypothetical protein
MMQVYAQPFILKFLLDAGEVVAGFEGWDGDKAHRTQLYRCLKKWDFPGSNPALP